MCRRHSRKCASNLRMAGLRGRGRSARLSAAVVLKQGREVEAPLIKAWVNERVSVCYQRVSEVVIMNTHDPVYTERARDMLRTPVRGEEPAAVLM